MNMGKKITDLSEGRAIPGESSYPVAMGDGTGVKQVKHKTLVEQLLADMEMPYDETLAMLTGTDEDGKQKIPNLQAISDWIRAKIVNNLLTTEEGFFLDARIGQVLAKRITANETAISQINSDLDSKLVKMRYIGVGLSSLEWTRSMRGMYYAEVPDSNFTELLSVTFGYFAQLDAETFIAPSIRENKIFLLCNKNQFYDSESVVYLYALYR